MDYIGDKNVLGTLGLVYGDLNLGVHGEDFHYIFSYKTGGPESLVLGGREWLYRTPKPTFWRALTDNDRGNGFGLRSGMWLAADMFLECKEVSLTVDGRKIPLPVAPENNRYSGRETAGEARIVYTYATLTCPPAKAETSYTVRGDGTILVEARYYGNKKLPGLPVFGMRFVMPTVAAGYRYEGLSGETYPDRMAGGVHGIYDIKGLPVTPYLVPQDCGVHMDTAWVEIYRDTGLDNTNTCTGRSVLRFSAENGNFAFSALPYTSEELENATHQEELPPARRTVVSILGAVRGVGGIDSWGADVEEAYHIDAGEDIAYSFRIGGGRDGR